MRRNRVLVFDREAAALHDHMDLVWEKLYEYIRRNRVLLVVFDKAAPASLEVVRLAPLGDVVTHEVRNINDYSFDAERRGDLLKICE